jgi:hypothetical protein
MHNMQLKKDLSARFPGTKFSVTTRDSGMIYVRWNSSLSPELVQPICDQYATVQFGSGSTNILASRRVVAS